MGNHSVYESTRNSVYAAACILPFTLLGAIAGGFFIWASGLNFLSVLFTVLGSVGSVVLLNSAWTRVELTRNGLRKMTLLKSGSLMWDEIATWSLFEPIHESSYLVFKSSTRKSMVIREADVESPGMASFLLELRTLAGELESRT